MSHSFRRIHAVFFRQFRNQSRMVTFIVLSAVILFPCTCFGQEIDFSLDDNSREYWNTLGEVSYWTNVFTPDPSMFPITIHQVSFFVSGPYAKTVLFFQSPQSGRSDYSDATLVYQEPLPETESERWTTVYLKRPVVFSTPGPILVGVANTGGYTAAMGVDATQPQGRSWYGRYHYPFPIPTTFPPPVWEKVLNGWNLMIRAKGTYSKNPARLILSGNRVAVSVAWRNQYSGLMGQANAIPQNDNFGYFYFSDKANPEVFVKVLDFKQGNPFLLFYGGLTDFEYTVTFENLCTGKKAVFVKPGGAAVGGVDNVRLPVDGCQPSIVDDSTTGILEFE